MKSLLKLLGLQRIPPETPEPRVQLAVVTEGRAVRCGGLVLAGRVINWRFGVEAQTSYGPSGPMAAIFHDVPVGDHYLSLVAWDDRGRVTEYGRMITVKELS